LLGTPEGIYRSNDLEHDWKAVSTLPSDLPNPVFFGPGSTVFALTREGLYRSIDHGVSWARVNEWPEFTSLIVDPSQPSVLIGGSTTKGLMLSQDGGARWESLRIQTPSPKGLESVLQRPRDFSIDQTTKPEEPKREAHHDPGRGSD
jgi:hypothetical protein